MRSMGEGACGHESAQRNGRSCAATPSQSFSAGDATLHSIANQESRNTGLPSSAPIGRYVLDFFCAQARLAVEIDGLSHDLGDGPQHDANRDTWLQARELTVMRIAASEVMLDADQAADAIVRMATEMIRAGAPSTALARGPPPPRSG
jgi:very-short-patch-repair endonuclease